MAHILQSQLEIDGYDSTTAGQIVKAVESKTDDVAYEYLLDLVDSKALINRYLAARKRQVPESLKPEAQATIEKSKGRPRPSGGVGTAAGASAGASAGGGAASASDAAHSRAGTPTLDPPHPKKNVPYARAFTKSGSQAPQRPKAKPSQPQENRQYKIDSITDLDAAIKKLDLSNKSIYCDCLGSVHGLLELAPNCLWCGKIICNKEGLGNCVSCGNPLIPQQELENISLVLHQQRAAIISSMGKTALKAAGIDPKLEANYTQAQSNLDKLLGFQASEAQRTKIIDNAEDFETTDLGLNQWATPLEQARQLRNQQRQERKQDELRKIRSGRGRKVVSINIRGDKVYEEITDAVESESESEQETEAEAGPADPNEQETRFWDTTKYGKGFVRPVYTGTAELPTSASEELNVSRSEQEVWAL